jgi:hypothetical protein
MDSRGVIRTETTSETTSGYFLTSGDFGYTRAFVSSTKPSIEYIIESYTSYLKGSIAALTTNLFFFFVVLVAFPHILSSIFDLLRIPPEGDTRFIGYFIYYLGIILPIIVLTQGTLDSIRDILHYKQQKKEALKKLQEFTLLEVKNVS